jgi:uncharacterized membrane protein
MKYKEILANRKGVAGLEILLSIITMLFMIGIIVMIFVIGGAQLESTVTGTSFKTSVSVTNETSAFVNVTGYQLGEGRYLLEAFVVSEVTNATNGTAGFPVIPVLSGNYTVSSTGLLTNATNTNYNSANVTYTYLYLADRSAESSINDTYQSLGTVTDWFATFIILGALVVLILLVVIIITSIKRSGITEGA